MSKLEKLLEKIKPMNMDIYNDTWKLNILPTIFEFIPYQYANYGMINYKTYYDIYKTDVKNTSCAYHKFNHLTNKSSIDNLVNMRLYEDVYKNALIDTMIKSIFRMLDFDKYKGRLYNAYIKLQIQNTAKSTLESMKGQYFKNYEIKNIGFVKTADAAGYIYIELLIMPYGFMEYINVVMEV